MRTLPVVAILLLTACVTINIYFPAAAAEKVADEIIQEIQNEDGTTAPSPTQSPQSALPINRNNPITTLVLKWVGYSLNYLIPPAYAGANLSVNTTEIKRLRAKMRNRFVLLKPFYNQGNIGLQANGLLLIRKPVNLRNRNKVNQLVTAENNDRQHLYQAIANANGHPEWFNQIQQTFATRWINHTHRGWWYQTPNGHWKQK